MGVYRSKAQKLSGLFQKIYMMGKNPQNVYWLACQRKPPPSWVAVLILLLFPPPPLKPFGNGENVKWRSEEYKTEAALAGLTARRERKKIRPQRG